MGDADKRPEELLHSASAKGGVDGQANPAEATSPMSDLLVRFISAVAMAGVSIIALYFGGWFWIGFVVLLAGLVLWEWNGIVSKFGVTAVAEIAWQFIGALYVGAAALAMVQVRLNYEMWAVFFAFLAPVVAVDVGAYFFGRLIGGPRIAPSISPSKTWAGLAGGMLAAAAVCITCEVMDIGPGSFAPGWSVVSAGSAILTGALIAIIAQTGDFFESWMKRRANVKDSGQLLPGHGGLFDRLDGFLAVFFTLFLIAIVPAYIGLG